MKERPSHTSAEAKGPTGRRRGTVKVAMCSYNHWSNEWTVTYLADAQ